VRLLSGVGYAAFCALAGIATAKHAIAKGNASALIVLPHGAAPERR
jgi:hypothetical protein